MGKSDDSEKSSSGISSQEHNKVKKNDAMSGDDSDSEESEDWEEVQDAEIDDDEADKEEALANYKPQLPEQGVQISIDGPKIFNKKRRKKQVDVNEILRQQLNRMKKEVQVEMHKTHLLCLLSRGFYLNHITRNPVISSYALSYLTDFSFDLKKVNLLFVRDFTNWFRSWFILEKTPKNTRSKAVDLIESLTKAFETRSVTSQVEYVLMYLSILRIYSPKIQLRLCYAINPVPLKPDDLIMTEKQQKGRKPKEESNKSPDEPTTSEYFKKSNSYKLYGEPSNKSKTKSTRASTSGRKRKKSSDDEESDEDVKPKRVTRQSKTNSKGKQPTKKRKNESEDEDEFNSDEDEKPSRRQTRGKGKQPAKRKKKSSDYEDEGSNPDSDSDEEDEKPSKRQSKGKSRGKGEQPVKKPKTETKKMISDDEDADELTVIQASPKKNITEYWCEIFVDTEEKWVCVDLELGTWDKPNDIEKKSHSPLLYVVSWDNFSHVKDVSQRYCSEFASCKFRRSRIDDEWWVETLSYFRPAKRTRQEKREDQELAQIFADRPMPTSLSDFKNHPLYVLKKHLLKYEVIYPPDAPILGKFRGEPIYARECVKDVHSREYWMRQARVVRPNEEAYKISVKRKKWDKNLGDFLRDLPLELFGEWQTDQYIPPDAKDGKVPRNQYGNVELFQPCMLPGGTVYLQLPGLIRIANKLKIDCAPAVTGFDNCSGGAGVHPVFEGFVVCEEFADTLKEAWEEEQRNIKKREIEKREKRIYGNWKRLIKGVLIREQLKLKYSSRDQEQDDSEPKAKKKKKSEVKSSMTMEDIDKALSMFAKKRSSRGSGRSSGRKPTKKETKGKSKSRRSRRKKESSDEEDEDEEDDDDFIVDDDEEIEEIEIKDEEDEIETEVDFSDSD